jgi:hypothetical protein
MKRYRRQDSGIATGGASDTHGGNALYFKKVTLEEAVA